MTEINIHSIVQPQSQKKRNVIGRLALGWQLTTAYELKIQMRKLRLLNQYLCTESEF